MEHRTGTESWHTADDLGYLCWFGRKTSSADGKCKFTKLKLCLCPAGGKHRNIGLRCLTSTVQKAFAARASGPCFIYMVSLHRYRICWLTLWRYREWAYARRD